MSCHTVILTISLSVGFLDSLHDPSAYVAPHDISDAAVPVNEHSLPPPPPPPGFFPSPGCRASAVERDITFWFRRIQVSNPRYRDPFRGLRR